MSDEKPHLREVERSEAIGHALWEAHTCIGQWAICAALAMLRKVVDLWSADYRDRHDLTFDASVGERDNVYWRLQKIAVANPLYGDAIHEILDGLRIDANDAIHQAIVCAGGHEGTYDAAAIMAIRAPALKLHGLVSQLVATTLRSFKPKISDESRWRGKPRRLL